MEALEATNRRTCPTDLEATDQDTCDSDSEDEPLTPIERQYNSMTPVQTRWHTVEPMDYVTPRLIPALKRERKENI